MLAQIVGKAHTNGLLDDIFLNVKPDNSNRYMIRPGQVLHFPNV